MCFSAGEDPLAGTGTPPSSCSNARAHTRTHTEVEGRVDGQIDRKNPDDLRVVSHLFSRNSDERFTITTALTSMRKH